MLESGKILDGKYQVVRQVGSGGMFDVYLLADVRLNKQWAGKRIQRTGDAERDALVLRSFQTEADLLRTLDHPALPRITDVFQEGDDLFVIMDFVEGSALDEVVERLGAQDQERVIEWGIQLCDVLDYLHTRTPPVIYRDMKPGNVMLTPDGQLKLIDFGIARHLREEGEGAPVAVSDATTLGTRGYAAPEQYGGADQTDARTDVYCLGATLHHLATGKSPAETPCELVPLRQLVPSLSAGFEAVIMKATAPNPDDRYRSCAEMQYALENHEQADAVHIRTLRRRLRAFRAAWISALACLLVCVGTMVARYVVMTGDYDHLIELAQSASGVAAKEGYYLEAIEVNPAGGRAYLGLIDLYRQDRQFTPEEEARLLDPLLLHYGALKSANADFAEVSYALGRAYWYDYRYADDESNDSIAGMRLSQSWFGNASDAEDFEYAAEAELYEGIAQFNVDITQRIEEGSDAGAYGPYFEKLQDLIGLIQDETNEVARLSAAELVDGALSSYSRKFRAEGVAQEELETMLRQAVQLAISTETTVDFTDAQKEEVLRRLAADEDIVTAAYQD